jgi:hypothetical protein
MSERARWKRDGRWPFQEIQGRTVIVVPPRRELHELDETATFLWRALERPCDAEALGVALAEEFDVDRAEAERDAAEFLASLEGKGLLVRA